MTIIEQNRQHFAVGTWVGGLYFWKCMDERLIDVVGGEGKFGGRMVDDAGLHVEGLFGWKGRTDGFVNCKQGIVVVDEACIFDGGTVMQINGEFLLPRAGESMIGGGDVK
jgi:hypothetical protein